MLSLTTLNAWSISVLIQDNSVAETLAMAIVSGEFEARDGVFQTVGERRQFRGGVGGLSGPFRRELRDAENRLHVFVSARSVAGLTSRGVRDRTDEFGELIRDLLDLAQRPIGFVRGFRALDYPLRAALHGFDRVLSVALNAFYDRSDMLGRFRRMLRKPLHFLSHDGKSASRF